MLKKREHTHTGNNEVYTVAVLHKFTQNGQIGLRVNCTGSGSRRFILFHDIVDKIKETKLILRVASSIEIYKDEYDFCKEKGITVVNDSNSTYDTIYQLITGKRFYEDDSTQSDVNSTVSDENSTLKDTITIKREKNSMFVYICGTEPIYNVGDVFAEYKCTPDYEGETTYGEIVEIKFDDYAEDWLYVFDNGTEVSEQYIISGDLYTLKR